MNKEKDLKNSKEWTKIKRGRKIGYSEQSKGEKKIKRGRKGKIINWRISKHRWEQTAKRGERKRKEWERGATIQKEEKREQIK